MALTVPFHSMWSHYPTPDKEPRDALFRSLGWDDLVNDSSYTNTCAIRMSVCLLRCGLTLSRGDLTVLKGPLKGKKVLIRFDDLAKYLKEKWGPPKILSNPTADSLIPYGNGVIVYFHLNPGGYPGHIDLFQVTRQTHQFLLWRWQDVATSCGSHCYDSNKCWFWPAQ